MKKLTSLILTFILMFSFAACRKEDTQNILTGIASTVISTAFETSTATEADTSKESSTKHSKAIETSKTTRISTTSKTEITETPTSICTTAEKKTKPSTTRRNYFPSKVSTTKKETTEKETTKKDASETSSATTVRDESFDSVRRPTSPNVTKNSTCTISISCSEILEDMGSLKKGKEAFVPSNGEILKAVTLEFSSGETVFDVLKRVCSEYSCADSCQYCQSSGIQLEYEFTPGYDNYYIEGIHQIYEKDCGSKSGWMYKVNGVFPNCGCSDYTLKSGDKIEFVYTLNLGEDIGAEL